MVLVAVRGSLRAEVDNGSERAWEQLSAPDNALIVSKGVWVRICGFQMNSVLLVASAANYEDVVYFDSPQPQLLRAA